MRVELHKGAVGDAVLDRVLVLLEEHVRGDDAFGELLAMTRGHDVVGIHEALVGPRLDHGVRHDLFKLLVRQVGLFDQS